MSSASDGLRESELRRKGRRRLALLLVPFALQSAGHLVGSAFAPVLLVRQPLLLIAVSPLIRHLVLASPGASATSFALVAVTSMFVTDPFMYLLGRDFGDESIGWIQRRAGLAGRALRWLERVFRRAGPLLVLVSPGPFVCALAGANRMHPALFVGLDLLGTCATVLLVQRFGEAAAAPIGVLRLFIESNVAVLTAISVLGVLVYALLRRRKAVAAAHGVDVPTSGPDPDAR